MEHKPSATAEKHYRRRPLDLLRQWHTKLEGKLWEMRMKGRDGIARAVYVVRTKQRLTVLHVFAKKTQKTPRKAQATARKRLETLTDD